MTRTLARRGITLLVSAIIGSMACSNGAGDPKQPGGTDMEKRDTEMKHEDCDLDSGSAKATDANGDKRPDIIRVYEGDREICRAVDINMDTVIDVFIYYDQQGQQRRRESGFDRDTRPDEISIYSGGVLIRKERETNNDGKIDTWDHYEGGRLVREERDSTGDGFIDQWWTFNRPNQPKCAIVVSDTDGDGHPDDDTQIDTCSKEKDKIFTGFSKDAGATPPGDIPDAQPSDAGLTQDVPEDEGY